MRRLYILYKRGREPLPRLLPPLRAFPVPPPPPKIVSRIETHPSVKYKTGEKNTKKYPTNPRSGTTLTNENSCINSKNGRACTRVHVHHTMNSLFDLIRLLYIQNAERTHAQTFSWNIQWVRGRRESYKCFAFSRRTVLNIRAAQHKSPAREIFIYSCCSARV